MCWFIHTLEYCLVIMKYLSAKNVNSTHILDNIFYERKLWMQCFYTNTTTLWTLYQSRFYVSETIKYTSCRITTPQRNNFSINSSVEFTAIAMFILALCQWKRTETILKRWDCNVGLVILSFHWSYYNPLKIELF